MLELRIAYHHDERVIVVSATQVIEVSGSDLEIADYIKDRLNNRYDLIIENIGLPVGCKNLIRQKTGLKRCQTDHP